MCIHSVSVLHESSHSMVSRNAIRVVGLQLPVKAALPEHVRMCHGRRKTVPQVSCLTALFFFATAKWQLHTSLHTQQPRHTTLNSKGGFTDLTPSHLRYTSQLCSAVYSVRLHAVALDSAVLYLDML